MPLITSLPLIRPKARAIRSPATPNQLARSANTVVGWLITAGVHSTVWIFASSAAITRRARWKSSSSSQCGYSDASRAQTALCSRANSVISMPMPVHQPGFIVGSSAGSSGIGS